MSRSFTILCLIGVVSCPLAYAQVSQKPRKLAPGVITVIRDVAIDDAVIDPPRRFAELLRVVNPPKWEPNFEPATQTLLQKANATTFRRGVSSLEFGFKPLRIQKVRGRDVWYLVYFVRNSAGIRAPNPDVEGEIETLNRPVAFAPTFVFEGRDSGIQRYDRDLPEAVAVIAARERVDGRLLSSKEISAEPIPVSTDDADKMVWGVATWDNVDPKTDFITIHVQGLTNAYKVEAPDALLTKTLELNFWRPGDGIRPHDREVRYGIPLFPDDPARQQRVLDAYGLEKPLEHRWSYR